MGKKKPGRDPKEFYLLALDGVFRGKEAVFCAEYGDWILPIQFLSDQGDVVGDGMGDEYYAARDDAAVMDLSRWEALTLNTPSQLAALGRLLTRDISGLKPGESRRSAWVHPHGRVRALVRLLAAAGGALLECPREAAGPLARELGVGRGCADRDPGPLVAFAVLGPKSGALLEKLGVPVAGLKDGGHREGLLPGPPLKVLRPDGKPWGAEDPVPVRVLRTDDLPSDGWLLFVPRERAGSAWKRLKEAGAVTAAYYAFDMHRIEQGLPWYGFDVSECTLEEAGLTDCLPLKKGSAHVPPPAQRLRRLLLDAVAAEGAPIRSAAGEEIGRVTTCQLGVATGLSMAFGFVREPWCGPGTIVKVGGRRAMVAGMKGALDGAAFKAAGRRPGLRDPDER